MTVEIIDTIFTDIFLLAFGILFVIALFKEWGDDNGSYRNDIVGHTSIHCFKHSGRASIRRCYVV